jgi:hypothetical protein
MQIEEKSDSIMIKTTDIHLPRSIGEALRHAYRGCLEFGYTAESYFVEVEWSRELQARPFIANIRQLLLGFCRTLWMNQFRCAARGDKAYKGDGSCPTCVSLLTSCFAKCRVMSARLSA